MPKERIPENNEAKGPPEVYCDLRALIALQYEAIGFSFLPKYAVQSLLAGRHRSKLRGRGLDFDEVRKYVQGDDIRNIDWKVTARVGKTHTKVFTEERERPVLLIVDQSSSMFFGSKLYLKSVIAAHLASLGAWRVLDVGDRVGGIVFDDKKLEFISPKRDRRTVQRFLSVVAEKNQALGPIAKNSTENMLNRSLHHANQVVNHDFLICIVSDFQKADDDSIKKMIQLARHNDVIAFQIFDPFEDDLPIGSIALSDGEFQTLIESQHKKIRSAFVEKQKQHKSWLVGQCKKYNFPLIEINTASSASVQLRRLLGGQLRSRRKRK